jgi:predicted small metal-binding protein
MAACLSVCLLAEENRGQETALRCRKDATSVSKGGISVAYSLNCKDTGADCGFAVTAETEDEVMQHVATHAAAAHPDMELTPQTVANVKSLIQKS